MQENEVCMRKNPYFGAQDEKTFENLREKKVVRPFTSLNCYSSSCKNMQQYCNFTVTCKY